ncbi:MAG: class I SAM-dependent RNA methyltransferase [Bacillota bacterium]|nr:class I SAM-dependent RNA methyltransferase [Bacillota bacterium]
MHAETINFAVPTLFGLESVAATELKRLGLAGVHAGNGRVYGSGGAADIPRLNINLRTGERVLILLGSFAARSFDELFEGVKALPWEDYIPADGSFPVKGHTLNSRLASEPACQAIIKKAVADRLTAHYHSALTEHGSLYQIQFSLIKDTVALMIDSSGAGLHKRGYRGQGVLAPLRETLAAGLVLLSHYHGDGLLCDPHCGSGTIVIEAALIAKNRAPGLDRSFACQRWGWLAGELWTQAAEEALDGEYDREYALWGGDIDPHAVHMAQRNAAAAEVDDIVSFNVLDSARFHRAEQTGRVITNPPYGERLLEREQAARLYAAFGKAMARMPDWRTHVLAAAPDFEHSFGRSAAKKRKLYNGPIQCCYYSFYK